MKVAIYPGSFNPWHDGHLDILTKASKVFDEIIVLKHLKKNDFIKSNIKPYKIGKCKIFYHYFIDSLLVDYLKKYSCNANAIIRGLRNSNDLHYETVQQYWNEDLGLKIPIIYFITDRKFVHISSSAIRAIEDITSSKP